MKKQAGAELGQAQLKLELDLIEQVMTGQDRSGQVRTGLDRSGHIKSDHVLTPETKKLLRELAQENRIALLRGLKKRKKHYLS